MNIRSTPLTRLISQRNRRSLEFVNSASCQRIPRQIGLRSSCHISIKALNESIQSFKVDNLQNKDFIKWRRFATEAVSVDVKEEAEHYEFQAETRQLLDIVTHSLYTDKEVFLRELVSNASDACEKLRHMQASGEHVVLDPDVPLEIRIWTDENELTLTVQDTGIGLSKEEMIMNLGTIARSGSKAFVQAMQNQSQPSALEQDVSRGIIGKFGVGFYSAFMVGDTVQVKSRYLPTLLKISIVKFLTFLMTQLYSLQARDN